MQKSLGVRALMTLVGRDFWTRRRPPPLGRPAFCRRWFCFEAKSECVESRATGDWGVTDEFGKRLLPTAWGHGPQTLSACL